jgi:hypothetical protein
LAISNDLIELIRSIVEEEDSKNNIENKIGKWWVGEVDSVNTTNNTATILFPNQTTPTDYIQNKTTQNLISGDAVYIYSPYGTIGSAWIDKVFKQYTEGGGGSGLDATTLNGYSGAYYLDFGNATNKPSTLSGYGITDATPSSHIGSNGNSHAVSTTSVNGFMSSSDKTKLDGIESNAEVNNISDINATDLTDGGDSSLHYHSTDRDRANHSGTQLLATISDAVTAASQSGLSATITTAKLTTLGTDGSMTFTNGVLTGQTAAT